MYEFAVMWGGGYDVSSLWAAGNMELGCCNDTMNNFIKHTEAHISSSLFQRSQAEA